MRASYVVAALVCLAALPLACGQRDPVRAPETGRLIVTSAPPGASVEIDGRLRAAETPDTLHVEVGTHIVRVHLDAHEALPGEAEVEVRLDDAARAEFCLRLTQATESRIVLVEHFANQDCAPCGPAEVVLHDYQAAHPASELVVIGYRTNFPSTQDPLYRENVPVHRDRMTYYTVFQAPTVIFDGTGSGQVVTETNLDALPFPDRDLIYGYDPFLASIAGKTFMHARGCPFNLSLIHI